MHPTTPPQTSKYRDAKHYLLMNEELINDKLELAKLYFKSKKYPDALILYNQLISSVQNYSKQDLITVRTAYKLPDAKSPYIGKLCHPRLITLLDSRAATHEKLGDTESALRDCDYMLVVNPAELKGYLRLGKLYLKLNDIPKALKNYQIGSYTLKKLMSQHPDIQINQSVYQSFKSNYSYAKSLKQSRDSLDNKVRDQLSFKRRKKTIDLFKYLSEDVLHLVFEDLPLSQILTCHLVCKNWYSRLKRMIYLYLDKLELKPKIKYKEFTGGTKMFSRLKRNLIGLRVNRTSELEFNKIFEALIKSNFKLKRLEMYNAIHLFEMLLKIDRINFKCSFKYCKTLKIAVSCPTTELLNLFPNLQTLELIIPDTLPQSATGMHSQIVHKSEFEKLAIAKSSYDNLETMVVLNNGKGLVSFPFLDLNFNFTKLIIARSQFSNVQHIFGKFLSNCNNLETLILEDNESLTLRHLFTNLVNYKTNFKLKKFIFRQAVSDESLDLQQFRPSDFGNFNQLQYLDLYGITLTKKGLFKFLDACSSLSTLVLGASNNFYFNPPPFSRTPRTQFSDIFKRLPLLESLSMVDLNLDNTSLIFLERDMKSLGIRLKMLDLSFNSGIDGVGLLRLLNYSESLIIDGVYINPDTIRMMNLRGMETKNDHMKLKWKQYGVNTFSLRS